LTGRTTKGVHYMNPYITKGKKLIRRLLCVLLTVCLLLSGWASSPFQVSADNTTERLSAEVLKTSDDPGGVTLVPPDSGAAAVADEWAYDEIRKLQISADFSDTIGDRTLQVELPAGMEFINGGYPTEDTDSSVIQSHTYEPCALPNGYVSKDGAQGGVLTYAVSPSAAQHVFTILIKYDESLWNKENGGAVTGSPEDGSGRYAIPVQVTLTAGSETETKVLTEIRSVSSGPKTYYTVYSEDQTLPSDKPLDKEVSLGLHRAYNGHKTGINDTPDNLYWDEITLVQEAPYKTDGSGTRIYADYAEGASILPAAGYTLEYNSGTHETTVVWQKGINFSYGVPSIDGKYRFDSSKGFSSGDTIYYPQPKIIVQGMYGNAYTYFEPGTPTVFRLDSKEKITISCNSKTFPAQAYGDIVYHLASYNLTNSGAGDSCPKLFTYTFEGTHGVGVPSVLLIMPNKSDLPLNAEGKVEITYTALDKEGVPVEGFTGYQALNPPTNNTSGLTLSRDAEMREKEYYFHTVTYQVKTLRAGTSYFAGTSPFISGGNFYGMLTGSSLKPTAGECLTGSLTVASVDEAGNVQEQPQAISSSADIKAVDSQGTVTMGLTDTKPLNGITSIPAGGTIPVTATLSASSYPYYNSFYIKTPVFYLRLPEGLSLVETSLKANRQGVSPVRQTPYPETDAQGNETGYTLTPITFTSDVPMGYYTEDLKAVSGGDSVQLSFALQASLNTTTIQSYNLCDLVCAGAGDAGLTKQTGGWLIYNWGHNPSEEDGLSKSTYRVTYSTNPNIPTSFTVQAAAPMVNFSGSVKEHGAADTEYGTDMTFIGNSGSLDYRITFSNQKKGEIDGSKFYYLLQLPKKGEQLADHISSIPTSSFDFSLTGPVTVESGNKDLYDIRYCVDSPPSGTVPDDYYNNGAADFSSGDSGSYATYYSQTEMETNSSLKWADVRSIKLVVKDTGGTRVIPDGEECSITLENVTWDVTDSGGNIDFDWSSCGLQRYNLGSLSSEGHTPTNPVTFHIHPYHISSSATLTGVKEGNPANGTTKTAKIAIPAYRNQKNLRIQSVTTDTGIQLVSSSDIAANKETALPWGDTHFAISAALNDEPAVDLSSGSDTVIGTTPLPDGTYADGSTLTFTLSHCDLMSTNSNIGEVTVVIGDGTDIVITETITLRTIGTAMNPQDLSGAITEGKKFSDIGNGGTQIAITSDSAVSVQFSIENYLYTSYDMPYIKGNFPAGTSVIATDITDSKKPVYYYYKCSANAEQIPLSAFLRMDNPSVSFDYNSLPVNPKLLFVQDYAQAAVTVSQKTAQSLELVFPPKEAAEARTVSASWEIAPKRDFNLELSQSQQTIQMTSKGTASISGKVTSNALSGNDTYHKSDYLTLSLSLYDQSGTVPVNFPSGSTITYGSTTAGTVENKGFLSLGIVGLQKDKDFSMTLSTTDWGLAPGTYQLKVELYCSRAEGYLPAASAEPEANTTITLAVDSNPAYGMKAEQTGKKDRLVSPGDALAFQLSYTAESDAAFSAVLYEKTKAGDYSSTPVGWKKAPTFTVSTDGTCASVITLPDTLERGKTYRIVFQLKTKGTLIETPYNVIMKE
jgi:hypothetical protein